MLFERIKSGKAKQVGVIVFGDVLNVRHWIDETKKTGHSALIRDGFVELYK